MGKAFTKKEVEEIRENIIVEAERIFIEKGLKKAGLQELTSSVGIALGSFYRFFESKEALFLELIDRYNSEIFKIQKEMIENQIKVKKFDFVAIIMTTFACYKEKPAYMMLFERNEEYDYLLSKTSNEKIKENINKDKAVTNYILDEAEKHWKLSPNYSREVVNGIFQYMFIGLVNRNIIEVDVVNEVLKTNAKIIAKYVETGIL